jgi:CubicO group peptidase (beta-lactamase class C family)
MSNNTHSDSLPAGLRDHMQKFMAERRIPGAQVAVVRDGSLVSLQALGLANVEHKIPVTHESVFSINSMAKAFTGVALMQLVEAGQLDLGAPVSRYLDGLPEAWRPVTVRQLATLTSGVPEIMFYNVDSTIGLIGGGGEKEAWEAAYALPMEFAPDRGYSYSQTNYALLGKIIDHLSGKPFAEFIAERQFAVASMSHTRYADDRDIIPNRATSYACIHASGDPAGGIYKMYLNWAPILRTAAGLHSTAEDLANWLIALQRGALVKQASSLETLWTPTPMHDGRLGIWGIGWLVNERATGRVCTPGGGSKAQIALYQDGLAVILLTNLIGAFPEHLAALKAEPIDVTFMDQIAQYYIR